MANRVQKGGYPYVIGHFKELLLKRFFEPSTPSMRKGCNREKKEKKLKEKTAEIVATNVATS